MVVTGVRASSVAIAAVHTVGSPAYRHLWLRQSMPLEIVEGARRQASVDASAIDVAPARVLCAILIRVPIAHAVRTDDQALSLAVNAARDGVTPLGVHTTAHIVRAAPSIHGEAVHAIWFCQKRSRGRK